MLLAHHLPIYHLARLEVAAGGGAAVYVKKHARKSEAPQGKTLVTGANNVGIEFCALCPAGCGGHISFKFDKARESYVLRKLEPCTCPRSTGKATVEREATHAFPAPARARADHPESIECKQRQDEDRGHPPGADALLADAADR